MASPAAVLSILVKADTDRATRNLTAVQARLDATSRAVDNLADKLTKLSIAKYTANLDFNDGKAVEQIDAFQEKLERLNKTLHPEVEVDTAKAREEIDSLQEKLDRLAHGDTANIDIDTAAATAKLEALRREINSVQDAGGGRSTVGGGTSGPGPGSLFGGGLFSARTVAAAAPFVPTIGASLGQGILGAGALGLAGIGAGGVGGAGIFSVAISGFGALSDAMKAYETQDKSAGAQAVATAQQQLQASAAQKSAAEAVSTAQTNLARTQVAGNQAVQGAEEALKNAQQQETYAQQALTQARKDAVRQLQDMRRAAAESVTAEQQARINLQMAQQALRQGQTQGVGGLQLKQLQLSVTEAQQSLHDAQITQTRDQQDFNKAQKQGINQMPQVVSAQRSLASAHQSVSDAATNLARTETSAKQSVSDAQRAVSDALKAQTLQMKQANLQAKALSISQNQLGVAMQDLAPSGKAVVHMLIDLQDRWKTLSMPAQNQFFGAISDGLAQANRMMPEFAKSAASSMGAARKAFDGFLSSLNKPDFQKFFHRMTETFAKGVEPLAKGFSNIARILIRIATAAAPALIKMLRGFREMTGDWLKQTDNAKKFRNEVGDVIRQFKDWLGLIGATARLLGALFLANNRGAKAGGNAIKQLTRTLNGWTDWIDTHRHKVNKFFVNLLHTVEILAGAVANLARSIAPISDAFVPISNAILKITTALNNLKVGNVSALTVLLGALTAKGIAGKIGGLAGLGGGEAAGGGLLAGMAGGSAVGGLALGGLGAAGGIGVAGAFLSKGGIPDTLKGNAVDTSVWGDLLKKTLTEVIQKYGSFNKAAAQMSSSQRDAFQSLITNAHNAGQITDSVFNKLTDTINHSTKSWQESMKNASQATGQSTKSIANSVGDAAVHVSKTYQGMVHVVGAGINWLTSNTSKAAQALGVKQQIKFHTTPSHVQGTVGNEHLAGLQKGGRIVPGMGSGDKIPAMLEPGEFVLNREAVKGIGMARLEAMNKALPRFKKGGMVFPLQGNFSWGRTDMGVDFGGTAQIAAMGDAVVTQIGAPGWPGGGGVVYKLLSGAPNVSPSSPYIYNFEHVSSRVKPGQKVKAGQVIASLLAGFPGLEMGFGTSSGQTLAQATTGYSEGQVTPAGQAMLKLLKGLSHGKFFGGSAPQLKRLILHGKQGALRLRDTGQASLDHVWKAGTHFLGSHQGHGVGNIKVPSGDLSKSQLVSLWNKTGSGGDANTMAAIALAESGGNPRAINSIGAKGLWQILPSTASEFGFNYGQLFNPVANAEGAHKVLAGQGLGAWSTYTGGQYRQYLQKGGMVMPPYGGSYAKGGVVPGPIGSPKTVVAHGGEMIGKPTVSVNLNFANGMEWLQDYVRAEASVEYDERAGLSRQTSRMQR